MRELTKEQIEWLNKCQGSVYSGKWKFNEETGLVDVDGDFSTPNSYISCKALGPQGGLQSRGITDFMGIKFGTVTGNFDCSYNKLENLDGAPMYVGGDFNCTFNNLKSLEGAPRRVMGDFNCSYNKLPNLEGSPMYVGGDFNCTDLYDQYYLESLQGAEECIINGNFESHYNKLEDIKGAPRLIYGQFIVVGSTYGSYKRIKKDTFLLITRTMEEKNLDYFDALFLLKDSLNKKELNRLVS